MEDLTNRFLEVLNYPLINRCPQIGLLIDRCSTKQLQDIFPTLIRSIFGLNGGCGWGFRTITRNSNPHEYEVLYHFFIPLGPMFRLCYRLLNDAQKFEIPLSFIPEKMRQMLETGRYPLFYSDIINIDPFERKITSLSLNSFDFYMLNFAIHGTVPIHKEYSAALQIQNDKLKSLYFFLAADYLCAFLPSDPESIVLPQNICSAKSSPIMPVQQIQSPTRSPKYLSLSAISHFSPANNPTTRAPDLPRAHAWRSESVLYIFVDTWLRFECDVHGDLPSNEFIRVARILVKQIHAFGNSADFDATSMSALRKIAQPMLNARMYPFLRTIMSRWPLDSSFSVVLELWLSFIQPWRYTFNRNISITHEIPIAPRYESFISENIVCYTQIYVQLISRFLSLDLTSFRNCLMVYRVLKVFGQSTLSEILRNYEFSFSTSFGNNTSNLYNGYSPRRGESSLRGMSFSNKSRTQDFSNFRPETNYFQDDTYIPMFGEDIVFQVNSLVQELEIAKAIVQEHIHKIEHEINEHYKGFLGWFRWFFSSYEPNYGGLNFIDYKKVPDILYICSHTLGRMFNIEVSEISIESLSTLNNNYTGNSTDFYNGETSTDFNLKNPRNISPTKMKKRALNISYSGDPDLMPIQNSECTVLVRFFYQLSCKINLMYYNEISELWHKNNFSGRIARHILKPPTIIQTFDKSVGYSKLKEEILAPRITLRFLAAYRTLAIIILSCILGQFIFNSPIFGFFILIFLVLLYFVFISFIHNVPIQ